MYYSAMDQLQIRDYYRRMNEQPCIIAFGEITAKPTPITANLVTYTDIIKLEFSKAFYPNPGFAVDCVYDFQSYFFQDSNFIKALFQNNPTVEEINLLLKNAVDLTQTRFPNDLLKGKLKERYFCKEKDSKKSIHDILKTNQGAIVLKSSLSHDISYKINKDINSVWKKKDIHQVANIIKENKNALIQEIIADIININHYIYFLNPEACILEIGLDIPKLFQSESGDSEIEIIRNWLFTLNVHLKRALCKEDIAYITGYSSNNMKRKQMIIAQEIIKALANKLPNQMMHLVSKSIQQEFTNQGL